MKEYIDCIGIDNKIHICKPHETKTYCGIKIIYKGIKRNDFINRYSCYQCSYFEDRD
jgi:hypothetical protein